MSSVIGEGKPEVDYSRKEDTEWDNWMHCTMFEGQGILLSYYFFEGGCASRLGGILVPPTSNWTRGHRSESAES